MRAFFIFSTYAVLGGPRFLFPSFLYFPLYAYAHKSVSEVISRLPNGASLAFERYFFIAAAPIVVLGVDDHDSLEALLRYEPSDFLSGSLEDGIVCVHRMQVMVKEDQLELLLVQRSKCRLGVLCKDQRPLWASAS